MRGSVGEVAERRARVRHALEQNLGEQANDAGRAVDLVDASRIALQVEPELSFHPSGARAAGLAALGQSVASATDELQTERGGGGKIDVGSNLIVERHAEDLADILREHVKCFGRLEQSSVPDVSGPPDAHDAGGRTIRIDEGQVDGGLVRGERLTGGGSSGPGESGDDRVTQTQVR